MIAYDFHIHSCLSPDADDNMTPQRIIDRAVANGLDIIAITDHNALDNARTASEIADDRITFLPGIEVESSEEVHVVCLFPDIISATRMERCVRVNMHNKRNKPRSFGNQYVIDEFGEIADEEGKLLRFPTKMTIEEIFYTARQMKGVAFYAHLEQKAYSVLSVLGTLPARPQAKALEFTNNEKGHNFADRKADKYDKLKLYSSNAHRLEDINSRENSHDLEAEGADLRDEAGRITPEAVINWLRSYEGI